MSELRQFKLPDVGEGLTEADIVRWLVQPGDKISINQTIVEIETAKAVVELPSPYEGVVADLLVPEGATADVGTPIISVQVGAAEAASAGDGQPSAAAAAEAVASAPAGQAPEISAPPTDGAVEPGLHGSPAPKAERQAVLVGYGVKLGATKRRPRKRAAGSAGAVTGSAAAPVLPAAAAQPPASAGAEALQPQAARSPVPPARVPPAPVPPAPAPQPAAAQPAAAQPAAAQRAAAQRPGTQAPVPIPASVPAAGQAANGTQAAILAKPPVRKLARDMGVDLTLLTGTGPSGSITRDDVQAAAAGAAGAAAGQAAAPDDQAGEPGSLDPAAAMRLAFLPREERIAIRGVRKHTAAAMAASAFTAPHVTEFLQIDMTETMTATVRLRSLPEFDGIRVTPLLLVAKALLVAASRHPMVNSSWDEAAQEIVVKHYINLGVATATDRGLVVPSVKDAHALSLPELARAFAKLAEVARAGKATPADLRGGTITITNVGIFGVDTGTPIITPGEAAILAFGQVKDAPWVIDGQLAVRKVCTLSLSFDHRIIDGDLGSAVLREVGAMLTDPLRMLAWS